MKHILHLIFLLLCFQQNKSVPNNNLDSKEYAMEQANLTRKHYKESKLDSAVISARNALKFYPEILLQTI